MTLTFISFDFITNRESRKKDIRNKTLSSQRLQPHVWKGLPTNKLNKRDALLHRSKYTFWKRSNKMRIDSPQAVTGGFRKKHMGKRCIMWRSFSMSGLHELTMSPMDYRWNHVQEDQGKGSSTKSQKTSGPGRILGGGSPYQVTTTGQWPCFYLSVFMWWICGTFTMT